MWKGASLFALPSEMICEGILPYLSVKDMRALNTVNKISRPMLHTVWKSFQYDRLDDIIYYSDIVWMHSVNIQILALKTREQLRQRDLANTLLFIQRNIPTLRKIDIRCIRRLRSRKPMLPVDLEVLRFSGILNELDALTLIQNYRKLHTIHIYDCNNIHDNVIRTICNNCSHLRHIGISKCRCLTGELVVHIAQSFPQLQSLDISRNPMYITDATVIAVAEHCRQLTSLNIAGCESISDAALIAIGQHCHGLKSITISCINDISYVGISALAAGCPLLQKFTAWQTEITDAGVIALARGCRDLRKIDIGNCKSIGFGAISAIAENCLLISELMLSYGLSVDDDCLYFIAQHFDNLVDLQVSTRRIISVNAVDTLIASCKKLQSITCYNTGTRHNANEWHLLQQKYRHVCIEF